MPHETTPIEPPAMQDQPMGQDAMSKAIFDYIKLHFFPADDIPDSLGLTTMELFERISQLYPDPPFDGQYLAQWLQGNGYRFADMGDLKFVWLIKSA